MIRVFDNLVPRSLADKLEQVFSDDDCVWNLSSSCGGYGETYPSKDLEILDTHQMYHVLVSDNQPKSAITALAMCVSFFLEQQSNIYPKYVSRVKANLLFPAFKNTNQCHPLHTDREEPESLSMIYYVNDSDGPTRFFDRDGTVIKTVQPTKGSAVVFPSNTIHASSCPIFSPKRIVINYVFFPE
jgi:hypothetical protein